jgi:hypothetical protein
MSQAAFLPRQPILGRAVGDDLIQIRLSIC